MKLTVYSTDMWLWLSQYTVQTCDYDSHSIQYSHVTMKLTVYSTDMCLWSSQYTVQTCVCEAHSIQYRHVFVKLTVYSTDMCLWSSQYTVGPYRHVVFNWQRGYKLKDDSDITIHGAYLYHCSSFLLRDTLIFFTMLFFFFRLMFLLYSPLMHNSSSPSSIKTYGSFYIQNSWNLLEFQRFWSQALKIPAIWSSQTSSAFLLSYSVQEL